jgi:hypothetical protein
MRINKTNRFLVLLFSSVLLLRACDTGYVKKDGKWYLTTGQFEGLRQPIGICYFSGGKLEKEKRDGTCGQGAVSGSDKAFSDASCKDGVFSCDDLGCDWWEEGSVMGAG